VFFVLPWFIFWLHHLDKVLFRKPRATDVASGLFFVGTKRLEPHTDRQVLDSYWARHVAA
jgi:hypothetical protein